MNTIHSEASMHRCMAAQKSHQSHELMSSKVTLSSIAQAPSFPEEQLS